MQPQEQYFLIERDVVELAVDFMGVGRDFTGQVATSKGQVEGQIG